MPEVTDFDLHWNDDISETPTEAAFKPPNADRFDDLGKALDAARSPPKADKRFPWIKAGPAVFRPEHIEQVNRYRDKP